MHIYVFSSYTHNIYIWFIQMYGDIYIYISIHCFLFWVSDTHIHMCIYIVWFDCCICWGVLSYIIDKWYGEWCSTTIYIYMYVYICIYIYIYVDIINVYIIYMCMYIYIYVYVYIYILKLYIHIFPPAAPGYLGRLPRRDSTGDRIFGWRWWHQARQNPADPTEKKPGGFGMGKSSKK